MGSDLLIVHAVDRTVFAYGGAEMAAYISEDEDVVDQAKAKLAELAAEAKRAKVRVETVLVEGLAAEEILGTAERISPDLILISVAEKGAVERALLGTTAERIIREATVPVLSIPEFV
jgi:nucleotide-binding universal stress UspA family protein